MIDIQNIRHQIDGVDILHPLSLTLPERQLIALIGPNGAGKSTLLSLIARLQPLQQGDIMIDGKSVRTTDTRELAQHIAIFQQHIHLMSRLRVRELLMMARFPYHQGWPKAHDRAVCQRMIEAFSLQDMAERFLDTLSGGQRQRALAAMVFAQDTPTILLDEPLNNLDMHHARELMGILRNAVDAHGKRIILVLHEVNYAARYADYVVAMSHGRIHCHGPAQEVLTAETLSALYQTPVSTLEHPSQRLCVYY